MGGTRENARRHCDREDRERRVAVARYRAETTNRSFRDTQYPAARRNANTRKAAHQDRIPRDNQPLCNAGNIWSTRQYSTGFQDLHVYRENPVIL